MRYLLAFVVGTLVGVCTAGALIYFNPLTRGQSLPANDAPWTLDYSFDPARNWIATHDRGLALGVAPAEVPLLWESGIRRSFLYAMPLGDAAGGPAAAATRISVPSPQTEFLQSGLLVDDFWLISVPGEGSVFVHSVSNLWPLIRDTVVRVDWLARTWEGTAVYGPTRGPGQSGATVLGLSGAFAGVRGRSRERVSLGQYGDGAGLAAATGQLQIELERPEP